MMRTAFILTLALVCSSVPAAAQSCINTTDLLAWWRADGSSADASGVGHGTFVGTERYEPGVSGQAFSFDGASYVKVAHDAAFTGNAGLTVAAWIKRGSQFGFLGPIMKMPGADDNSGFAFEMFGDHANLYIALEANEFDGTGWRAPVGAHVPADIWTHVAGTFDGTTLSFYVNGQLAESRVVPGKIRPAGGELHIGHDPINPDRFVRGPVDEAIAFGRALTAQEVQLLYDGGLASCTLDTRERPVITWNPAGGITTMTPLDGSHFNASSAATGGFEYAPAAGTLLPEGMTTLVATFVPDDQIRYQVTKAYRQVSVSWQDSTSELSTPIIGAVITDVGGIEAAAIVDASRERVWIVGGGGTALVVIDGKTGAQIASLPVSTPLSGHLAFDAARGHVYAAEAHQARVRVFDADSHTEINNFGLNVAVTALHVDPVSDRLYVGLGSVERLGAFQLPVESPAPTMVMNLAIGGPAILIASDPARKLLYVQSDVSSRDVSAVDIDPEGSTFHSVLWRQPTNALRGALAVNSRAGLVYAGEGNPGRGVRVLDGRRDSSTFGGLLASFAMPPDRTGTRAVSGLAVNPISGILYAQLADVGFTDGSYHPILAGVDATSGALLSEVRLDPFLHVYGGRLSINPATNRLYVVGDYLSLTIVQDAHGAMQTIVDDAAVAPVTIDTPPASVTFADVNAGGTLNVESFDVTAAGIPAAGQFKLSEAIGFAISTTATVSAPIVVCINASHVTDPDAFGALSLLHAEVIDGTYQWVDRTVSRDFGTGMVCGETMSLSPFAVARRIGPRYVLTPVEDYGRARQGGSTIPLQVRVAQDGVDVSNARLAVTVVDVVHLQSGATAAASDAGHSNPGGLFRFDEVARAYIFNLSTRGLAAGPYVLRVRIGTERQTHDVRFDVR